MSAWQQLPWAGQLHRQLHHPEKGDGSRTSGAVLHSLVIARRHTRQGLCGSHPASQRERIQHQ